MNLTQAKNEDEKSPIEKRIARITGGVAVIQVGAATETEMKEKLDRFDDAVRATKAAISEGYVAGGGTAFIRCMQKVVYGVVSPDKKYEDGFINFLLVQPLNQICKNAGIENIEDMIKSVCQAKGGVGYNAKTDKVEDLLKAGIIDPVKVLRCALQNAASSAGMILTSEVLIVDMIFEATNNFVYIIRNETEKEVSGLLIPGQGQKKQAIGTVYSVGGLSRDPKILNSEGKKVKFFDGVGFEQEIEGQIYLVLTDDQITGVEK